jgi:hypothetical protein
MKITSKIEESLLNLLNEFYQTNSNKFQDFGIIWSKNIQNIQKQEMFDLFLGYFELILRVYQTRKY